MAMNLELGGDMLGSIRRKLRALKQSSSGNAAMLVALGLPALMGSSGLAVDVAQWYMWQRELQFAADQAALAGAWARSSNVTQGTYVTRARQEFDANLATTDGATATPGVTMSSYNGGSNNAVRVTASATKTLPFSSFITGRAATVSVSSTATFSISSTYNACLLSVNPVENRSVIFGNAITGGSDCGVGALSTGDQAIVETGDSEVALGDIISAGGIEETFSNNGTIHENVSGLSDPYNSLTAPSSAGRPAYTYECPTAAAGTTTWTANQTVRTEVNYVYKRGNPLSSATPVTLTATQIGYLAPIDNTVGPASITYTTAPTAGSDIVGPNTGAYSHVAGTGGSRIWRAAVTTVTTTTDTVVGPIITGASDGIARPLPGVYTNISITCPTVFSSGIYFVSGSIDFGQNQSVTGSDVMFVMTGAAGDVHINSNSLVTLSGITAATLENRYGYSASQAAKMKNMLFFDKDNTSDFDINGNATIDLNGILYMPAREVTINGNMSTGTRCIMLVADTFVVTGSANLTNFCSPDGGGGMLIGDRLATVRLVA
jgi:Flp pilus assembly protein TadG